MSFGNTPSVDVSRVNDTSAVEDIAFSEYKLPSGLLFCVADIEIVSVSPVTVNGERCGPMEFLHEFSAMHNLGSAICTFEIVAFGEKFNLHVSTDPTVPSSLTSLVGFYSQHPEVQGLPQVIAA
jgi:hypothetical protein